MIVILSILGFILLLTGLYFLLHDFSRFIISKTSNIRFPKTFVNLGEFFVTLFVICSISLVGFIFYKFTTAFVSYLLSDDLVSFFVLLRGVFTVKSELQNPLLSENLLSGLILTPALQFVTFYFIFKANRSFMLSVNERYGKSIYGESDVLYFGFLSAILFILLEIVFYSQKIPGVSGIAHLTYLSASKFSSICYYLTIAHIHLLKNQQYTTSLSKDVVMNRWENKIVYTPWKTIIVSYLIGMILYIPFYTGTQFSDNNVIVVIIYIIACICFYFTLKLSLSNSFNYLGFIMLAKSPDYLMSTNEIHVNKYEKYFTYAILGMAFLLLILKANLFLFILICFVLVAVIFFLVHLLTYFLGLFVSFVRIKWNPEIINLINISELKKYVWTTLKATLKAVAPMCLFVCFVLILLSFFPKKYEDTNIDYISSVFDVDGNPLYIGYSEKISCIPVSHEGIPDFLLKCLYIQEDRDFSQQNSWFPKRSNWHGISFASLYRMFKGGGGSNLNMQLIKNVAFPKAFPQDVQRKFSETLASYQLSIQHSKEFIVTQYLNTVGLNGGKGHSGIMAASLYTFGLPISKINPLEIMYLIATLKRGFNFETDKGYIKYEDAALHASEIKSTLLLKAESWYKKDFISKREYYSLRNRDLRFINKVYKTNCVTTTNVFLAKEIDNVIPKGKTYTSCLTLLNQQKIANAISEFQFQMRGYTRSGKCNLYSAALVVDITTGQILAHHGGQGVSDLTRFSEGNPMGSIIKPFIFLEMLEDGFEADKIILYDGQIRGKKTPNNYNGVFSNEYVGMNYIIKKSLNAPVVNIREVTDPIALFEKIEDRFANMGISNDRFLDLDNPNKRTENELNYPLGSRNMTLFDIAQAYQTVFNNGQYVKLNVFPNSYDPYKNLNIEYSVPQRQLYDLSNALSIKSALRQPMQEGGTGFSMNRFLPKNRVFYAKTGTSDRSIHGYTVLCDGNILVVAYTTYGRVSNGRLELNNTPPIPFGSGVKSAGVLAALIISEFE